MKKRLAGLVAVLLLTTAGAAVAGERAGAFSISPYIGGYTFDGVQRLDTNLVYGGRIGYDITNNWAVEGSGEYARTHNTTSPAKGINVINYRLEGLYNFTPEGKFVPFLALGGGGSTITMPGKTNTDATAQWGAGLKYFVTDNLALRGDVRQIFSFHDNNTINPKPVPNFMNPGGSYWINYEYVVGLQYTFGPIKPCCPPINCQVSDWSDWGSCENGFKTRTRQVLVRKPMAELVPINWWIESSALSPQTQ